jgi:hypothetical protein
MKLAILTACAVIDLKLPRAVQGLPIRSLPLRVGMLGTGNDHIHKMFSFFSANALIFIVNTIII